MMQRDTREYLRGFALGDPYLQHRIKQAGKERTPEGKGYWLLEAEMNLNLKRRRYFFRQLSGNPVIGVQGIHIFQSIGPRTLVALGIMWVSGWYHSRRHKQYSRSVWAHL